MSEGGLGMWILIACLVLGVIATLASLCYVRRRSDADEAASELSAAREAERRAGEYAQYMVQRAWQRQLNEDRRRARNQ
jgi:hypothetical protein